MSYQQGLKPIRPQFRKEFKYVPKFKHVNSPVDFNGTSYMFKVKHLLKNLAESQPNKAVQIERDTFYAE